MSIKQIVKGSLDIYKTEDILWITSYRLLVGYNYLCSMLNLDQIEALQKRVDALKEYLQIETKRMEVQEDDKQTHDPE